MPSAAGTRSAVTVAVVAGGRADALMLSASADTSMPVAAAALATFMTNSAAELEGPALLLVCDGGVFRGSRSDGEAGRSDGETGRLRLCFLVRARGSTGSGGSAGDGICGCGGSGAAAAAATVRNCMMPS